MLRSIRSILPLCLLLFTQTGVAQSDSEASHTTAIVNATIVDGRGNPPLHNHTLIFHEDRIVKLIPDSSAEVPAGATVIDMQDRYLLPGLIDVHVHLATDPEAGDSVEENLPRLGHYLRGGVTAVRDMGGDSRVLGYLARQALLDTIDSPDIYYSAIIGGPEFFSDPRTVSSAKGFAAGTVPWMQAVDSGSDLDSAMALAKGNGVTGIKIYRHIDAQLMAPLARAAAQQGLMSWAHLDVDPAPPSSVAQAGVTAVSHAAYFLGRARKEQQRWKEGLVYNTQMAETSKVAGIVQALANEGTVLDATLVIFARGVEETDEPYYLNAHRAGIDFTRLAHRAGVRIAAGTDLGINADQPLPPVHDELVLLVERVGLSPLEAIQAATSHGALVLGKDREFGALAPGMKANLVILNSDPLADIANTRDIAYVVKNGRFICPQQGTGSGDCRP